jgi:two-component system, chemotaxis family, sensor kinase CheA
MKNFPRWLIPVIILVAIFLIASTVLYIRGRDSGSYVETNGAVVQVAGKTRLEWHRTLRYLSELRHGDPSEKAAALTSLRETTKNVEDGLKALNEGGVQEISRGNQIALAPGSTPAPAREAAAELYSIWSQVGGRIKSVVASNSPDQNAIDKASEYTLSQEQQISGLMSRMLGLISFSSIDATTRLARLQQLASILGTLFIGLLIGLYSWQLRKVNAVKKDTDEILQTVPTGLFLLDKHLKVGAQHSLHLQKILGQSRIAGRDFSDLFGQMADTETMSTARDYLGLLIADQVDESLVADVNPLDQVNAVIANDSGRTERRTLGFGFKRVVNRGKFSHLLVTVNDITERSLLAEQVLKLEKQLDQSSSSNMDLIISALSMERSLLNDRLQRYEELLNEANTQLKESSKGVITYRTLIDQVFRPLHTLRGETAALGLKMISSAAGDMEAELINLRQKPDLTGNDFLPVTMRLDELYDRLSKLKQLVARLPDPSLSAAPAVAPKPVARSVNFITATQAAVQVKAPITAVEATAVQATATPVRRFDFSLIQQACVRTAEKLGKNVVMQGTNVNAASVPDPLKQTVTDVLVQLVRNALAHGIETPSERAQSGKAEQGRIAVQFAQTPDGYELVFRDDGRGLDFESIRARSIALGRLDATAAAALDARQLAGLIFEPGFSTAAKSSDTAGSGVGLDVVMAAVKRVGGKIAVGTQPGQYTQFRMRFPLQEGA